MRKVRLDPRYGTERTNLVRDGKALGRLVRQRRKELGLTQADLAEATGYSKRLIGELENGRDTVGVGKILWICDNIGMDIEAVMRGK